MQSLSKRTSIWLALLAALLVLVVAAPVAAAAGQEKSGAGPLSAEFLRYQADQKIRHILGLDRVPGVVPGLVPTPMDLSYLKGIRSAPPTVALAATYDLRALGKVSSVKNQNPYGSCWAFATCGSLESVMLPGEAADFSEDNIVLTAGYDVRQSLYDDGGNCWKSTAYLARWGGPVNESDDAYGDHTTPPGLSPRKHVQEVVMVPTRSSALDNDGIKSAVMQYGAAYVAVGWYGSSEGSAYYNPSTASYYYNGTEDSNHAVLIVGWDDNYAASNFATAPPGNGAFIVKNSWGPSWGSSGYFYASYYDTKFGRDGVMAVFNKAEPTNNYTSIYQYDPLGDCNDYGYTSPTGWFANVFTAQSTTSLGAVGFWTLTPSTSFEVYVGSSLASKTLCTSGTMASMGYHTVALPSPVGITSGQQFAVAVKVTSPGTNYPIAFEAPYANLSSTATAQAGQSFVSSTGTSWTDLTTRIANANVCLKAYTKASVAAQPTISSLSPNHGKAGDTVVVSGSGFGSTGSLKFGGVTATTSSWSNTAITAAVPGGLSSGALSVTVTSGGQTSSGFTFTVDAVIGNPPAISAVSPNHGKAGDTVVVTGSNFTPSGTLKFGGVTATTSSWSNTAITAAVPAGLSSGALSVTVTSGGQTSNGFTFTVDAVIGNPPAISAISPGHGKAGDTVVLTGSNFTTSGTLKFGSVTAATMTWTDSAIVATVPNGLSGGAVSVTVTAGGQTSSGFTFTVDVIGNPPVISAVSPDHGKAADTVVLTGTNLGTSGTVKFGTSTAATSTWTATVIVCTVPQGLSAGAVNITVTVAGQTSNALSFTVGGGGGGDDTTGPVCAAKNVTVKHDKSCRIYFKVTDEQSAQVTCLLAITTKTGSVKKSWSWDYDEPPSGWWYINYKCTLAKGSYRILVGGEDLAGNAASVIGRATLTVK